MEGAGASMTPQECHWHNFRLIRPRVRGMSRADRLALFSRMREGIAMMGLRAILEHLP